MKKMISLLLALFLSIQMMVNPAIQVEAHEHDHVQELEDVTVAENETEEIVENPPVAASQEESSASSDGYVQANVLASGMSGNVSWAVYSDGLLTFGGYGDCYACIYEYPQVPWMPYVNIIKRAQISTTSMTNMGFLFAGLYNLESVYFYPSFSTSNVSIMENMFDGCSSLKSLDLSGFDTSNVAMFNNMFSGCSSLETLNISSFDTSSAIYMDNMFKGCSSLQSLDVSGFNTSNVTEMDSMFEDCSSLTSIDVSGFNTTNTEKMSYMFYGCSSLSSLYLLNFDTANVKEMACMFSRCSSLTTLDLSSFNFSKCKYIGNMFEKCENLETLYVGNIDTRAVIREEGRYNPFYKSANLKSIYCTSTFDEFRQNNSTLLAMMSDTALKRGFTIIASDGVFTTSAKNVWDYYNGAWHYYDENEQMVTGFAILPGEYRYYFNEYGEMQTGFQVIDGKTYYFGEDGVQVIGLVRMNDKLYYFGSEQFEPGWIRVQLSSRYQYPDASLAVGWTEIDGKTFYFDESGIAQFGITEIDGVKYHFNSSNGMTIGFVGTYISSTHSEYKYYFGPEMRYGWIVDTDGGIYYANANGVILWDGDYTIDGHTYTFDYLGELETNCEHDLQTLSDGLEPTCTEIGYAEQTVCSKCHVVFSYARELPALGHDYSVEISPRVEPTVNATGMSAIYKCSRCNSTIGGETIPKHEHRRDSGVITQMPTCTQSGTRTYSCIDCGIDMGQETLPASGHLNIISNFVAATCTEGGYTGDCYCSRCNELVSQGVQTEPIGHDFSKIKWSKRLPTCSQDGSEETRECYRCNATTGGETIPKVDHNFIRKYRVEATCYSEGYTGNLMCSMCDLKIEDGQVIPMTDHEFEMKAKEIPATCNSRHGYGRTAIYKCKWCNYITGGEEIPPTEHTPIPCPGFEINCGTEIVPYICASCGEGLYDGPPEEIIPHTPEVFYFYEPTCSEDGYTGDIKCAVCWKDLEKGTTIPMLTDHAWEAVPEWRMVEATCTTNGYEQGYRCKYCWTYKQDMIPAIGHNYIRVLEYPSTCYEGGAYAYKCINCGHIEDYEFLEPLGHDIVLLHYVEATCETDGYSGDPYCLRCHETLDTGHRVPADNHLYTFIDPDPESTCLNSNTVKKCLRCGLREGDTIDNPIHSEEVGVVKVPSTCTEEGIIEYRCADCGTFLREDVLPKQEHITIVLNRDELTCDKAGYSGDVYCVACEDIIEYGHVIEAGVHNYSVKISDGIDPTCIRKGQGAVYKCKYCNETTGGEELDYAEHEADEGIICLQPTCSTYGIIKYRCKNCESELSDESLYPLGHDYSVLVRERIEPTCTTLGYTEIKQCSRCQAQTGGQAIPESSHIDGDELAVIDATCTTEGMKYIYCADCGCYIRSAAIPALGHDKEVINIPSTCTTTGVSGKEVCKRCQQVLFEGTIVPMADHAFTIEETSEVPSTCYEHGHSAIYKCANCDARSGGNTLPYADHITEESILMNPTCTDAGLLATVCINCGITVGDVYHMDPLGHDPYLNNAQEATCSSEGYTGDMTCSRCNIVLEQGTSTPVLGHTFTIKVADEVSPTCSTTGLTAIYKCSSCDETIGGTVIPTISHTVKTDGGTAATCTEPGLTGKKYCSVCGYVITEGRETNPLGHNFSVLVMGGEPPTCRYEGREDLYKCSRCDETIGGEAIPITDHEADVMNPAIFGSTCSFTGLIAYYCKYCNTCMSTEVIPKLDHIEDTDHPVITPSTCTTQGKEVYKCVECRTILRSVTLPLADHEENPTPAIDEATCLETGTMTYTCKHCNEVLREETIPSLGHTYPDNFTTVREATYFEEGLKVKKCIRCETGIEQAIPKLIPGNGWQKDNNGTWYYFVNGSPVNGWQKIGNVWYYFHENKMLANTVMQIGTDYYGFDSNGAMVTGWKQFGADWYYFESNGTAARNKWVGNYYLYDNGVMATNAWIGNYYVGADGVWVPNAQRYTWISEGSLWKLYDTKDLVYVTSSWATVSGKQYYFDAYGIMVTNVYEVPGQGTFYFGSDGAMKTGWQQIGADWYYFSETMVVHSWVGDYYFDQYGAMVTSCYVYNPNNGKYYWIGSDGKYVARWTTTTTPSGYDIYDQDTGVLI